ncbi:MAG: ligase-associated DNA damage response DEXH box helicase, partial [Bacteroidetes bacterium]|nr:ligase-associated DNA damage response DEXH box helicase [Bacteroidota bacterium]
MDHVQAYRNWFASKKWQCFPFQQECADAYWLGSSGLLNAPTGSGKTYALALPAMLEHKFKNSDKKGLYLLWITPLKALSSDIKTAIQTAADELGINWEVGLRNGDTDNAERSRQKKNMPQCMVITPESLHIMLASKGYSDLFNNLSAVVVDEWHELIGSKRGVQVELALSRLRAIKTDLKVWGISATIGNLEEAARVLLPPPTQPVFIQSTITKRPEIHTVFPENIETLPWAGHLGISMLNKVIPIIENSNTCLIFTNTRSQSEIWYQRLLEAQPSLAGRMAIHHGSLTREVRDWVEQNLHSGLLKAVVCTSSLDLGVDFRPVDTVIQIGSPKGVARFVQRAGRSGHRPGETSQIWFVPTHSLELLEAAALKSAVAENRVESRIPVVRAMDVLIQYLITLAVSEGFYPETVFKEITQTHAFESLTIEEWQWLLSFITTGGSGLQQYDDFHKVIVDENGCYKVISRRIAMQHRLSIGTIAGDTSVSVKILGGARLGTIEEYFISKLKEGDVFVFAGRMLEFMRLEANTALVRKSSKTKGLVPSWQGGRMSLTSELSFALRRKIETHSHPEDEEVKALKPLFELQQERSQIPAKDELLIEYFESSEGFHLFVFPFEGRMVNEGMAMLMAYRLGQFKPASFSIAMNDYGFELLSPEPIPWEEALEEDIFNTQNLIADLYSSTNYTEMCRRRFSDIARISGLVFKGTAEKPIKGRHLQANAKLFFEVFKEYEPENLLLWQA